MTTFFIDVVVVLIIINAGIRGYKTMFGYEAINDLFLLGLPAGAITLVAKLFYQNQLSPSAVRTDNKPFTRSSDWIKAATGTLLVTLIVSAGRYYQVYSNNHAPCFDNGNTVPCTAADRKYNHEPYFFNPFNG